MRRFLIIASIVACIGVAPASADMTLCVYDGVRSCSSGEFLAEPALGKSFTSGSSAGLNNPLGFETGRLEHAGALRARRLCHARLETDAVPGGPPGEAHYPLLEGSACVHPRPVLGVWGDYYYGAGHAKSASATHDVSWSIGHEHGATWTRGDGALRYGLYSDPTTNVELGNLYNRFVMNMPEDYDLSKGEYSGLKQDQMAMMISTPAVVIMGVIGWGLARWVGRLHG